MNNTFDEENPTRRSVIQSHYTRDGNVANMEPTSQNIHTSQHFLHPLFNSRQYSPFIPGLLPNSPSNQPSPSQVEHYSQPGYLPAHMYPAQHYTERPNVFSQIYCQKYYKNHQLEDKGEDQSYESCSSDKDSGDNSYGSSCEDNRSSFNDDNHIQDNLKRPPNNVTSDNNVKRQRLESSTPTVKTDKALSNCHVCGDLAVAHKHYGGVCCYSCKAFFRRASQTGKDKKYKCKKDNNCDVTYTSRKSCQYCRFNKCLQIGMKPNWVLSDEQCNIRFRNTKYETKNKCQNEAGEVNQGSDNHLVGSPVKKPQIEKGLLMPFTTEESESVNILVSNYTLSKETFTFSDENEVLWNRLFNKNCSQVNKHDYSSLDFGSLIQTVVKKNIFFVRTHHLFSQLSKNDQKLLLQKNMSEMCHIRGAIRFDTKSKNFVWYFSKKDQLKMTFEKNNPVGKAHLKNALIGHQDMSKFHKDTTSSNIFNLVNKLCGIDIPMEVFLIMINIVLFSSDTLELEGKKIVEESQVKSMLFLHRYLYDLFGRDMGRKKLSQIMTFLTDLRQLCDQQKNDKLPQLNRSS